MALKNPTHYPRWSVLTWDECENNEGGYYADRYLLDSFDNEQDALALYESTALTGDIVEVDLELDTGNDCVPIRHKDSLGEYIY